MHQKQNRCSRLRLGTDHASKKSHLVPRDEKERNIQNRNYFRSLLILWGHISRTKLTQQSYRIASRTDRWTYVQCHGARPQIATSKILWFVPKSRRSGDNLLNSISRRPLELSCSLQFVPLKWSVWAVSEVLLYSFTEEEEQGVQFSWTFDKRLSARKKKRGVLQTLLNHFQPSLHVLKLLSS